MLEALKCIKRDTAAGPGKCRLSDIVDLTSQKFLRNAAATCRTSVLPKTIKDEDQVGNSEPVTIDHLLTGIYGKTWIKDYKLNSRKKGFVPARGGCFENVNILKNIIAN